jgi:hypothetical protein
MNTELNKDQIAELVAVGIKHERERIIKLIQEWINNDDADFQEMFAQVKKGA